MEIPSTTWFSEALCTSLYKDSHSPSPNSSCMTTLDDESPYITSNYTDLSDACRTQIGHDDSKKFNNNSGETISDNNRNSDSDKGDNNNRDSDNGDKNNGDNENNNYLMLQAKQRLSNSQGSSTHNTSEEYIDLDKLYQSQRLLLNTSSGSSTIPSGSSLNYQNINHHHHHLQHAINHHHHQDILANQISCLPKDAPRSHNHQHASHHQLIQGHSTSQGQRISQDQGHSQGQGSSQGHRSHHHHAGSSSASPTTTSLAPSHHLHSDHNHQRHQQHLHHLPQQLPSAHAHQPSPLNNSHHPYTNYPPSVFNGDTNPVTSHGRDGYGHPSTGSEPNDYSSYAQQQYPNYNEDPDSDSESEHQRDSEVQPVKKRPGRPRGSRRKKPEKLGRLWEFIRDLLLNNETCPSLICWDNYEEGMFRFVHSDKVAKLWGAKRDNPDMNYEKLSRAMRYYYKSKVLQPVFGRRLVYKFGPEAKGWKTENPNFRC